jgi:hypothetical protein
MLIPKFMLALYRTLPRWVRKARTGGTGSGYLELAFLILLFLHFAGRQ